MEKKLKKYFDQEISLLDTIFNGEFKELYPSVAKKRKLDPDVKSLLKGVAYLTGIINKKNDDDFPEIIHELIRIIFPHYLRPIPSMTIVSFKPNKNHINSVIIEREKTSLKSKPVEQAGRVTNCLFRTCFDVELHPLELRSATLSENIKGYPTIKLSFKFNGIDINEWQINKLRLHLSGKNFVEASNLYFTLMQYLTAFSIKTDDEVVEFQKEMLVPVGFSEEDAVIPYPANSFWAYRVLQEYFILPQKFLFIDLIGLDSWKTKSENFDIIFELEKTPKFMGSINLSNFVLFATPVVNLFHCDANPIELDHKTKKYQLTPDSEEYCQIFSVKTVSGHIQGKNKRKIYEPFDRVIGQNKSKPIYTTHIEKGITASNNDEYQLSISFLYNNKQSIQQETIFTELLCTNGILPEKLEEGTITEKADTSPDKATFENIIGCTSIVLPPDDKNSLWHLISHLSLNYLSLENKDNLKSLLKNYSIINDSMMENQLYANIYKKIDSIEKVTSMPFDEIIDGVMMRGKEITIEANSDAFLSTGDFYLFGCIMDFFIRSYASLNTFTKLVLKDIYSKAGPFKWKARIGERIQV